jgi:hypothetical protein
MSQALRGFLLSIREMLVSAGPVALLGVGLLVLAYWWLDPNPPKRVTLATGPAQSAYDEFGKRYAKALALEGIEVELLPSEGSSDNLRLLREGKVDLGFVQGGSGEATREADQSLLSLGSLFVEPVWLFYRADSARKINTSATFASLAQLKGMRVNIGTAGSGVPSLVDKLLDVNRIDPKTIWLKQMEQTQATVAFLGGELDAVLFASAPESLMVQMLLQTPGVKLMDFPQSEAYSRRFAFLTPVVLPRGVVDLAGNLPAQDVRLVASTTTLLTRDSTHPALLQLFAQAALKLHGGAGWFNRARDFPKAGLNEIPLAPQAERAITQGVPLLQRYLPFWIANLIERMWLALGIILAMLLPLSRIVPPLYEFRIRRRVFRWYGQLRDIEERSKSAGGRQELMEELDELADRVSQITVPLSYADELYALRSHVEAVRQRLRQA